MARRPSGPRNIVAAIVVLLISAVTAWMNRSPEAQPQPVPERRQEAPRVPAPAPAPSPAPSSADSEFQLPDVPASELEQIRKTIALIQSEGPFPHKKDGTIFRNAEKKLPRQPQGYYREYTVETPGAPTRGTRRIVRGKGGELYYTRDHYRSFVKLTRE